MAAQIGNLTPEERWWRERISLLVAPDWPVWVGKRQQGNPLRCPDTDEPFEFGDIRIEAPLRTVLIEIEGQGQGAPLSNLLKFYPWLRGEVYPQPRKPVSVLHIWGSSYPTHKLLWRRVKSDFLDRSSFLVPAEFIGISAGRSAEEEVSSFLMGSSSFPVKQVT